MAAFPLPLPPLSEQEQIVTEVEAKLSNLAQLEATIKADLKWAEQERQSILLEAFAGRLVAQDPNDEPASVLLGRIQEERRRREEAEKTSKEERKMTMAQQRKKSKNAAPLYDVLVEAGGTLTPEDLYKQSDNQRKTMPEEERSEDFYIELNTEVTASLIEEDRPASDKILLHALVQDSDDHEVEDGREELAFPQIEMRQARERSELDLKEIPHLEFEMRQAREWSELDLKEVPHLEFEMRHEREQSELAPKELPLIEFEMRQARVWSEPDTITQLESEMSETRREQGQSEANQDKRPKGKKHHTKEDVNEPLPWDE